MNKPEAALVHRLADQGSESTKANHHQDGLFNQVVVGSTQRLEGQESWPLHRFRFRYIVKPNYGAKRVMNQTQQIVYVVDDDESVLAQVSENLAELDVEVRAFSYGRSF